MVEDLTGLAVAGASLLDEATAAAEAMTLARRAARKGSIFLADARCLPQTLAVLATRAEPLGIDLVVAEVTEQEIAAQPAGELFGVLLPYPDATGEIRDLRPVIAAASGGGRAHRGGRGPAGPHAADAAGRAGRRHRGGHHPAVRRPDGIRRPARRLHRGPRRPAAPAARAAGRRVRGRRRAPGLPARAAGQGAAHPPGKGDEQHLHRPGAARRHRRDVRGLPRPGRAGRDRPAACTAGPPCWPPRSARRAGTVAHERSSTRSPSTASRAAPRRAMERARRPGLQPLPGRPGHGAGGLRRDDHRRAPARRGRRAGRRGSGRRGAGGGGRRAPGRAARGPRPSSPTRCSTSTAARPRCCATCGGWRTSTSRSTGR